MDSKDGLSSLDADPGATLSDRLSTLDAARALANANLVIDPSLSAEAGDHVDLEGLEGIEGIEGMDTVPGEEGENGETGAGQAGGAARTPIRRIDKACENCRRRRIKCVPPYPCKGCRDLGVAEDCSVRVRARPNRAKRVSRPEYRNGDANGHGTEEDTGGVGPASSGARRRPRESDAGSNGNYVVGSQLPMRTRFITGIEREVEAMYEQLTGQTISLALQEEFTHPSLPLSARLPPIPTITPVHSHALQLFIRFHLPFCSYTTGDDIIALFERYRANPDTVGLDERALVFACLALGTIRLTGFDAESGRGRWVREEDREDPAWYRNAIDSLHQLRDRPTFTSLQALSVLSFYCTLACTSGATRDIVAWLNEQGKQIGVLGRNASSDAAPPDRTDLILFSIIYANYYASSLTGFPSLIEMDDFDRVTNHPHPPRANSILHPSRPGTFGADSGRTASSSTPVEQTTTKGRYIVVRRPFLDLVSLNTKLISHMFASSVEGLSIDWVLGLEAEWFQWSQTWIREKQSTGSHFVDPFVGFAWDWGRIILRSVCINDPQLGLSSIAILARSASAILRRYDVLYRDLFYNLIWTHVRQITTSAHLVLLCYRRYEFTKDEAEDLIGVAARLLAMFVVRWDRQASDARDKFLAVAQAFGLQVPITGVPEPKVYPPIASQHPPQPLQPPSQPLPHFQIPMSNDHLNPDLSHQMNIHSHPGLAHTHSHSHTHTPTLANPDGGAGIQANSGNTGGNGMTSAADTTEGYEAAMSLLYQQLGPLDQSFWTSGNAWLSAAHH